MRLIITKKPPKIARDFNKIACKRVIYSIGRVTTEIVKEIRKLIYKSERNENV